MKDPIPTFSYLVSEIAKRYPDLAYIHVVEPRVTGNYDREPQAGEVSNHPFTLSSHFPNLYSRTTISFGKFGHLVPSSALEGTTETLQLMLQRRQMI